MAMQLIGPVYLVGGQDFNWVHLDWPANDPNVYLIHTRDTFILVDCGCGDSLPGILDNVANLGVDVADLSHLLLTHAHFPHAAACDAVQKMGVEVVASAQTAEAVREGDLRTASFCYGRQFPPCEAEPTVLAPGEELEVGAVKLRAVALPGHSPDHMGYELSAEERLMLFCGDAVRSPMLRSRRDRFGFAPDTWIETLRELLERPPDVLYPGHGPFCLSEGRRWIQEQLRRLTENAS